MAAPDPLLGLAPPRPRRGRRQAGTVLRAAAGLVVAAGALLAWTVQGGPAAWDAWQAAVHTPTAAGVSYDEQRLTLEGNTLYPLLVAARSACPAGRPILSLSDDSRAEQQGNYILYPRRIDAVHSADPLDQAVLTAHRGGCVFTFGPTGGRLDPFRPQLTERACTRDGCLYQIR